MPAPALAADTPNLSPLPLPLPPGGRFPNPDVRERLTGTTVARQQCRAALARVKAHLWNGTSIAPDQGQVEYICHGLMYLAHPGIPELLLEDLKHTVDHRLRLPYPCGLQPDLGWWLREIGAVSSEWHHAVTLQAHRRAWLAHMIEEFDY